MTGPFWALPALAPADPGNANGPPSTRPNNTDNPGSKHRSTEGTENTAGADHKSGSHKCTAHKVGYVASGVLKSWKLEKNTDGTYTAHFDFSWQIDAAVTFDSVVADQHNTVGDKVSLQFHALSANGPAFNQALLSELQGAGQTRH